jgi:hypothetical protein
MSQDTVRTELAMVAARLVVEEGLEYGPAKQRARKWLAKRGLQDIGRADLPDNDEIEAEVRAHLALFCADTQPAELAALREAALVWMERLAEFRPHVVGAVWRGTATRLNGVHLELYCDDPKAAEIALLNAGVRYEVGSSQAPNGRGGGHPIDVLRIEHRPAAGNDPIPVYLDILDHDDLRGGLQPDAQGRTRRGDTAALRRLMETR